MKPHEYQEHPLWTAVTGLADALGKVQKPDGDEIHQIERVRVTHGELDQRRDLDPYLMDETMLDQVQTSAEAVRAAMAAYAEDPQESADQLETAVAQTAQVLTHLRTWPQPAADTATKATKAAASKFHTTIDEMLGALRQKADTLADRLDEVDALGKERTEAAKAALQELGTAIEASNTEVTALAARLTGQIDSQKTAFDAEATARADSFNTEVKRLAAQAKEQAEDLAEKSRQVQDAQAAKADEIVASLEQREERARALLDSTSRHAIAGDYGKWAARQAKAALNWTIATVFIGLCTAVALYIAIDSTADDSIQFTLYKTGVSVIGLIVAGYCARQAAEHRREERVAKRLHLDLNALEPFLEQVEDPAALRTEIAKRVFVPQQPEQLEPVPRFGFRRGLSFTEFTALLAVLKGGPPGP